jgi:hypothetical protein
LHKLLRQFIRLSIRAETGRVPFKNKKTTRAAESSPSGSLLSVAAGPPPALANFSSNHDYCPRRCNAELTPPASSGMKLWHAGPPLLQRSSVCRAQCLKMNDLRRSYDAQ